MPSFAKPSVLTGPLSEQGAATIANPPYSWLIDIAGTNLCTNPSGETNSTNYSTQGTSVTLTRLNTATIAWTGAYFHRINKTSAVVGDGLTYLHTGVSAATQYTISVVLQAHAAAGNQTVHLEVVDNATAPVTVVARSFGLGTNPARYEITITTGAAATQFTFKVVSHIAQNIDFDVDALQIESGRATATSYMDGDLGPGYAWTGTAHASTSTRTGGSKWLDVPTGGLSMVLSQDREYLRICNAPAYYGDVSPTPRFIDFDFRTTTLVDYYGVENILWVDPQSNSSAIYGGYDGGIVVPRSNTFNFTGALYGVGPYVVHEGSGSVALSEACAAVVWHNGSGTLTVSAAFVSGHTEIRPDSTGTVTYTMGHWHDISDTGSTGSYGLWISHSGIKAALPSTQITNTTDAIGILVRSGSPSAPGGNIQMGQTTGTTTNAYGVAIYGAPYISTTNTRTITNAATLYIDGPPTNAGNVVFSNLNYAVYVNSGMAIFSAGTAFSVAYGASLTMTGTFAQTAGVWGIGMSSNITQGATNTAGWLMAYFARINTAASAITLTNGAAYYADAPTIGAASTLTNYFGFYTPVQTALGVLGYGIFVQGGMTYLGGPVQTGKPRVWFAQANTAAATLSTVGNAVAPTVTSGTAATNQRDANGDWLRFSTTAVNNNVASVLWAAFTHTRLNWTPQFWTTIEIPTITTVRVHVGLYSATPAAADSLATVSALGFRFSTGAADTTWQCISSNGTTQTIINSNVTVVAATRYDLVIDSRDAANVRFYINDKLVATATATLPAVATDLGMGETVTTLTTVQRDLQVAVMQLSDKG